MTQGRNRGPRAGAAPVEDGGATAVAAALVEADPQDPDAPAGGDGEEPQAQVVEWDPEVKAGADTPVRTWDGVCTRMRVAYPMLRGDKDANGNPLGPPRVVGGGDHVTFLASYDREARRWFGPEAQHVEDLLAQGNITGSRRQEERAAQVAAVEHERGCWPTPDGKPALRPELRARTTEQVIRELERVLGGGWLELRRIEAQEAQSNRNEQAATVDKLAAAIREGGASASVNPEVMAQAIVIAMQAMGVQPAQFPGSAGPGSELGKLRAGQPAAGGQED